MHVLFFLETHFKKLLILGVKAIISGDLTVRKALNNRAQDGAGEGGTLMMDWGSKIRIKELVFWLKI